MVDLRIISKLVFGLCICCLFSVLVCLLFMSAQVCALVFSYSCTVCARRRMCVFVERIGRDSDAVCRWRARR